MSKAILEFNLSDPDDERRFKVASKAVEWYLVAVELDKELRDMIKYHEAPEEVSTIRKKLYELMQEYGVSLDDMA